METQQPLTLTCKMIMKLLSISRSTFARMKRKGIFRHIPEGPRANQLYPMSQITDFVNSVPPKKDKK